MNTFNVIATEDTVAQQKTLIGNLGFLKFPVLTNRRPTASNLSASESYVQATPKTLTQIEIVDADPGQTITATLTLSNTSAGTLNTGTSGTVTSTFSSGVWRASGPVAYVNALLASLTFTSAVGFYSTFTIATSVTDGVSTPQTGTKNMTGSAS